MNITQIMAEADILVPNDMIEGDKITYLNQVNLDFFNIVKIPKLARITGVAGQPEYTLASDVRQKNIDLVEVGLLKYMNLMVDGVNPTQNVFSFDDQTSKLTLSPAPYRSALPGVVRYHRIGTTTFTSAEPLAQPDAPEEYHWTYVPALAAFIANTQDDGVKAGNYEAQYKAAWNLAAQNYNAGTVNR